jgi:hypothetical protein
LLYAAGFKEEGMIMMIYFLIAALITISHISEFKAVENIENLHLFGINADSTSATDIDSLALANFDSIKTLSPINGQDIFKPEIDLSYSFSDLPCIKLYHLRPGDNTDMTERDPKRWVLFNSCDTTSYYFGGDISKFSDFFKEYIRSDTTQQRIVDILALYLNSTKPRDPYYILNKIDDFSDICNYYIKNGGTFVDTSELKTDKIAVKKYIGPIKFNKIENGYNIELVTWEYFDGELSYWNFEIADGRMRVIDKEREIINVGPYKGF